MPLGYHPVQISVDDFFVEREQTPKDKDGNYINEPIDAYNHLLDGARYYTLGRIMGKIVKPKNMTKEQLGLY